MKSPLHISLVLCAFLCAATSFAQKVPDGLPELPVLEPDTLRAGDTLAVETRSREGVDTTVVYSAEKIDFDVVRRVTVLSKSAAISYKDMTLTAGRIEVDWENQLLLASPAIDTFYTDSARTEIDTVLTHDFPRFQQGRDDFTGDEIAYNMKTKIGRVREGRTHYQDGEYRGEQFTRIADDVITARSARFTTCDLDPPHYHFGSNRLKIMVGDRVVAKPVIIYFDDVPVFAAPYGIFPSKSGRTSGIIIPTFGESAAQGRFLRDMGYYWAPYQYMDLLAKMDYFEKFGVLGRATYRYAKRYVLNGSTDFFFDTQRQGVTRNRDYRITSRHNHTIDPNTRLSVNASYVSSKRFINDTGSLNDLLNQSVNSNATLSKSWNNSPWTASVNLGYQQNIETETWSASLPRIQFTHKTGDLFPAPKAPRNIRGAVALKEARVPWYRSFKWSYRTEYRKDLSFPDRPREEGLRLEPIGIDGSQGSPTRIMGTDSSVIYNREGLSHDGSFSANATVLKYLRLNPSLSWHSDWVARVVNYEAEDRVLNRADEDGFFARTWFDLGTSATTKLYGLARRPLGIGADFRHVMTPTVSFTYRPDFSDEKWGYYKTVTLPDGRSYTFDRFQGSEMAANVGGTPKGLSERISFGLNHLFQMRTGDAEEETERKYDLLSVSMGTGVDLKRDSLKWDGLRTSFRTRIPGKLIGPIQSPSFDVSMTHNLYERVDNRLVNRFYWERDGASWYSPLELTNLGMTAGFSIKPETIGSLFGSTDESITLLDDSLIVQGDTLVVPFDPKLSDPDIRPNIPPPPQSEQTTGPSQLADMPLDISMTFHRTTNFVSQTSTNTMRSSIRTSLTPRWDATLSYNFDLDRRLPQNASVTITRDLHCWEASFRWSPLGYTPGYFLRIGLRSPQLQDVKVERHRGGNLGRYF